LVIRINARKLQQKAPYALSSKFVTIQLYVVTPRKESRIMQSV